jgi:hypothetical protein
MAKKLLSVTRTDEGEIRFNKSDGKVVTESITGRRHRKNKPPQSVRQKKGQKTSAGSQKGTKPPVFTGANSAKKRRKSKKIILSSFLI